MDIEPGVPSKSSTSTFSAGSRHSPTSCVSPNLSRTYSDCSVPRKRHRHSTSDHRFREEAHPCYAGFNNTAPRCRNYRSNASSAATEGLVTDCYSFLSKRYAVSLLMNKNYLCATFPRRSRGVIHAQSVLYFQAVLIIGWPAPDIFTRVVVTCILRSRLIVCTLR